MTTTNLTIPETTLQQLGGAARLKAMIGAKMFVGDERTLQFRFAAPATNKANCLRITLDPTDTYTVEFWRCRGLAQDKVDEVGLVYGDSLRGLIESKTGLRLSL